MHRIAYETITENNPKNLNEPLEFTINAINDRQYIDLYDSYITFDLNIHTNPADKFKNDKVNVNMYNTAPGLIEQANISNIIYFDGDTIKNATFDSIRQAPDYRTLIRSLFINKEQEQHEEADNNLPILINTKYEGNSNYNDIYQVHRSLTPLEKDSECLYSTRFKIPLRLLFEIANEENFINYKEITFNILFKDPKKSMYFNNKPLEYQYVVKTTDPTDPKKEIETTYTYTLTPNKFTYDNVQIMYHYYQDLNLTEQPPIHNTPLQAFQFPAKIVDSKNIIQKSLLMNDVYRYLMIFVTPIEESVALMENTLVSKITLGCQGKSFWTMNFTTDQLYDYLSYCISKNNEGHSVLNRYYYPTTMPISLFPIDEIIEYDAPGFLDINLEFPKPDYEKSVVHLVFFGK